MTHLGQSLDRLDPRWQGADRNLARLALDVPSYKKAQGLPGEIPPLQEVPFSGLGISALGADLKLFTHPHLPGLLSS